MPMVYVIVHEVIQGPILDRGFLDVRFSGLRDVVVGGLITCERSYSARVPRSSLARVHREFVHHIVEDEVDGQEERQDDRREDRQRRAESGAVEEESEQTHERMEMAHDK